MEIGRTTKEGLTADKLFDSNLSPQKIWILAIINIVLQSQSEIHQQHEFLKFLEQQSC